MDRSIHDVCGLAVRGFIEPAITPGVAPEVVVAPQVLGCLGSAYPAWRATRLDVAEALRRK